MKRYVPGIDVGGTETQALIADEAGYAKGLGMAGPSNFDDLGTKRAWAGIAEIVWIEGQQKCSELAGELEYTL